jgi:catecholate siderophore receptor
MGNRQGVRAYRVSRAGRLAGGVAAIAGAAGLAAGAQAAPDEMAAIDVSGVTVNGRHANLDGDTGLALVPTTIQDTPQAINVVGQLQMKAQGVNTLEQALRNVPGITIAIGEGGALNGDQFKIRGFDAKDDIYVDGLRDFGVYTRDSFNYEEVQVLKGPSGAMFGRGTTGGVINTISKRPMLRDQVSIDAYAGNGDYYRALADINHQLSDTSAFRINLMGSSTGVVDRDLIRSKRWGAAASVAFGLGTDTTVNVSYLHQHDKRRPDYGIIIVQRPGEIIAKPATEYDVGVDRSNFLGFRNDVDRSNADIFTVRLTHKASDSLTFTSDSRFGVYSRYFQYSTLDQCNAACTTALFDGDPATEAFGGIGGSSPYDSKSWGLQNISTARLDHDFGSLRNQLIVGFDVSRQSNDRKFLAYTLPPGLTTRPSMPHPIVTPSVEFPAGYNLFNPVPAPGGNITCPATGACTTDILGATVSTNVSGTGVYRSNGDSTSLSAFFTDRLWISDTLSVIGSLRLERYKAELDTITYAGVATAPNGLKVKSTLKSPRVSVVFEPRDDQTFYASWGRSQTPQGASIVNIGGAALTAAAKDLDPERSEILEVGAKVGIPNSGLSLTVSAFDVKKNNALQTDPATGFLQAQSGERQEVKGVEIGLSGSLASGWTVSAGYTYLDAKIKESFSNCAVPNTTTGTPTGVVCPVGATSAMPVLNTVAVGRQVVFVPKHSASLYTNLDLGRWIEGLSVGGDISYQSKIAGAYTARSVSYADRATLTAVRLPVIPSSVTLNAFASYRIGAYRVGLNVYNLTNALNYTQVFGNRAVPTPGRTFIVSLGATF